MLALKHPDNSGKLNMKELEQMVAGFLAYQREIELKAEAERQAKEHAKARRKNELAQRETDSALSKAAATSYELMDICDRNSRNGLLTVLEIVSFCTAPKYKDFVEWLKADNYKALKSHDVDHSGDISRVELEQIVSNYFDEVGRAPRARDFRRVAPFSRTRPLPSPRPAHRPPPCSRHPSLSLSLVPPRAAQRLGDASAARVDRPRIALARLELADGGVELADAVAVHRKLLEMLQSPKVLG